MRVIRKTMLALGLLAVVLVSGCATAQKQCARQHPVLIPTGKGFIHVAACDEKATDAGER